MVRERPPRRLLRRLLIAGALLLIVVLIPVGWLLRAPIAGLRRRVAASAPPASLTLDSAQASEALALASAGDVRILRATLLADPRVVQGTWQPGNDSTGRYVEGEVLFSVTRQLGVMRLIGLAPNDTARWRYHLWIEGGSTPGQAVDGGTFDVPAGVVDRLVPFRAGGQVRAATAFTVTVESAAPAPSTTPDRSRIAMTASVTASVTP